MKDYNRFLKEIRTFIPKDRIYVDELRRLAWGTDAGFYRLIPKIVIRSMDEQEVSRIMKAASSEGISVTFRAAGTSLSGQAISDSVLIVAGKNWEQYSYDPVTTDITLEPGLVGAEVNRILAKYGRHFGPDPASIGSCMVGGIVMNNASGMSCGIEFNSDRMLSSARLVFPDGTILDTCSPESRDAFMKVHPEIIKGIASLREEVLADQELSSRIERKYSIKNVTGLNLLPFLRYSDPFEILAHLMVGSEGTLAFMSLVRMRTLPTKRFKASAMIYFPTIRSAAEGVVAMRRGKEVTGCWNSAVGGWNGAAGGQDGVAGRQDGATRGGKEVLGGDGGFEGIAGSAGDNEVLRPTPPASCSAVDASGSTVASGSTADAGSTAPASDTTVVASGRTVASGGTVASGSAVDPARPLQINAAELLDRRSLASVHDPHLDPSLPDLTAVLTEVVGETREELLSRIEGVTRALEPFGVEVNFSEDPEVCARYWAIRSGIFPTVGGMRKEGTTCLIEDVAFHIEDLPEATSDLSALLDRHGYDDSCIYGHALAGNFHFIINQSFSEESEVRRYEAMIKDVAALVVGKYDGSLKAEHGTGRNMAPFVPYEWGDKAFRVMKRIKELIDPQGILNPGVIFNDDPDCFLKDFKPLPILRPEDPSKGLNNDRNHHPDTGQDNTLNARNHHQGTELAQGVQNDEFYRQINKCIECGFCEVNCLSCGFTLSPRTRIVIRREISRLRALLADSGTAQATTNFSTTLTSTDSGTALATPQTGAPADPGTIHTETGPTLASTETGAAIASRAAIESRIQELERDYRYLGEETCAADGLCSTSCPMGINVAELTHRIRQENIGSGAKALWTFAGSHYHSVKNGLRGVLGLANLGRNILGTKAMASLGRGLHSSLGLPLWTPSTPRPYHIPKMLPDAISNPDAADSPTGKDHTDKNFQSRTPHKESGDRPMVVYLPSCMNQMMGTAGTHDKNAVSSGSAAVSGGQTHHSAPTRLRPLAEEMVDLLHKAGYGVIFPKDMDDLCCGMLWETKGMPDIAEKKVRELEKALWVASEGGRYPILCDQSPCLHRLRAHLKSPRQHSSTEQITPATTTSSLLVYEPAEFIMTFLRDRLEFHQKSCPVAIHITCTMRLMKLTGVITDLAHLCSSEVIIPEGVGCCGFAGDKGMTHPELNAYALRKLRRAVNPDAVSGSSTTAGAPASSPSPSSPSSPVAVGYSNSRTCEIGLETNSGIPYVSIVYLVNSCTTRRYTDSFIEQQ